MLYMRLPFGVIIINCAVRHQNAFFVRDTWLLARYLRRMKWHQIRHALSNKFYDFRWSLAYSLSRLPFTCSTQCSDGLILNSVTGCMATDKFNQFAVVRRRQMYYASIIVHRQYSLPSWSFRYLLNLLFSYKKTTFAFIIQNFHVNSRSIAQ